MCIFIIIFKLKKIFQKSNLKTETILSFEQSDSKLGLFESTKRDRLGLKS